MKKTYLRVAKVRSSRWGYKEVFSLVEDIEQDKKDTQDAVEVRYFKLEEVKE